MKLPVAPEFKRALIECISLVSVVQISIERIIDVLQALRALVESCLGNLLSHFGLWGWAILSGAEKETEGTSIGSQISVLTSSTSNTVNLLTSSNWGALFASYARQNPPLGLSKLPFPLLYPSGPLSLQSIPPSVLQLIFGRPDGRGSPS